MNFRALSTLEILIKPMITLTMNLVLKTGFRLPLIDNITLSDNADIVTKNGYVRIDSDLIYLPSKDLKKFLEKTSKNF